MAQSVTHVVDQIFVLPPGDPPLGAGGATVLEGAGLALVDPVSPNLTADFGGPVTTLRFRVYQIGALGRGAIAEALV